jgi:hypothetical protein
VSLGGQPHEVLPAPLLEDIRQEQELDPFLDGAPTDETVDLFGPRIDTTSPRTIRRDIRRDAVWRLAAGMLGLTLEDLTKRRERRRRKIRQRVAAVLAAPWACAEWAALAEARAQLGEASRAATLLETAAAIFLEDPEEQARCSTRIAESAERIDPDSASSYWRRAYDRALQLNPDHAGFGGAAFGFHRDLARRGLHEEALTSLASLPFDRGWELAAAIAESVDRSDRGAEGDVYWSLAKRTAERTSGELQRQTNLSLLAQALAARGDLRTARLLCADCAAQERLEALAAVLAGGARPERCSGYRFVSMVEFWLEP